MLSLNKSYKNRKVPLSIHCKYKYFDSTVQRAEDRWQEFYFSRLPFAVNVKLNLSNIYKNRERKLLFVRNVSYFICQYQVKRGVAWYLVNNILAQLLSNDTY